MEYISKQKVEDIIFLGLNNPNKLNAFGHDAVEILTEVHFMEPEKVRPNIEAYWIRLSQGDKFELRLTCSNCNSFILDDEEDKNNYHFCPHCGAEMLNHS